MAHAGSTSKMTSTQQRAVTDLYLHRWSIHNFNVAGTPALNHRRRRPAQHRSMSGYVFYSRTVAAKNQRQNMRIGFGKRTPYGGFLCPTRYEQ